MVFRSAICKCCSAFQLSGRKISRTSQKLFLTCHVKQNSLKTSFNDSRQYSSICTHTFKQSDEFKILYPVKQSRLCSSLAFVPSHEPLSDDHVGKLQEFISKSKKILVLTGAGISTESGIPDYRSEGVGLYATTTKRPVQIKVNEIILDFFFQLLSCNLLFT